VYSEIKIKKHYFFYLPYLAKIGLFLTFSFVSTRPMFLSKSIVIKKYNYLKIKLRMLENVLGETKNVQKTNIILISTTPWFPAVSPSFSPTSDRWRKEIEQKESRYMYDHGWSCAMLIQALSPNRSIRHSYRSVMGCLGIRHDL